MNPCVNSQKPQSIIKVPTPTPFLSLDFLECLEPLSGNKGKEHDEGGDEKDDDGCDPESTLHEKTLDVGFLNLHEFEELVFEDAESRIDGVHHVLVTNEAVDANCEWENNLSISLDLATKAQPEGTIPKAS